MSLRILIVFLSLFVLLACSSPQGRAPVTDLTLGKQSRSGPTVARGVKTGQKIYIVQKGDTLYSISWKTGVEVKSLVKHNNINAPYLIKQGQKLYLLESDNAYAGKTNNKSDLSSQTANKNSNSGCTAQNCNKKQPTEVAQKNTKAYSANKADTKTVKNTNKSTTSQKVSGWSWPVNGKLTKPFSASQSGKQGISIVSKRGTSIKATASGKVVYAGSGLRGYGNLIIIKHNDDYLSAYAHNESLLVGESDEIKMGQKIAVMGDSGSDHVHLHFEIRYRGKSVDPVRYLPKR